MISRYRRKVVNPADASPQPSSRPASLSEDQQLAGRGRYGRKEKAQKEDKEEDSAEERIAGRAKGFYY